MQYRVGDEKKFISIGLIQLQIIDHSILLQPRLGLQLPRYVGMCVNKEKSENV